MPNVAVRTCALEGRVGTRSAGGQNERLPGVSLELVAVGLEQLTRFTVTNEQGESRFTNLPEVLYTMKVLELE